jgi:hypothetical protein
MSGVAVISYLLKHDASVIATIPTARIITGDMPLSTTLPAISIRKISRTRRDVVKKVAGKMQFDERVQVTCRAKTYASTQALMTLVFNALPNMRGTINGVDTVTITDDAVGPDLEDIDIPLYEQSQDYFVRFNL